MEFSITPVPHSVGTSGSFLNKTNKASGFHFLTENTPQLEVQPNDAMYQYIQDGNAIFRALTAVPQIFQGICLKFLDQMVGKNFVFLTESYFPYSIKSRERICLGTLLR